MLVCVGGAGVGSGARRTMYNLPAETGTGGRGGDPGSRMVAGEGTTGEASICLSETSAAGAGLPSVRQG